MHASSLGNVAGGYIVTLLKQDSTTAIFQGTLRLFWDSYLLIHLFIFDDFITFAAASFKKKFTRWWLSTKFVKSSCGFIHYYYFTHTKNLLFRAGIQCLCFS